MIQKPDGAWGRDDDRLVETARQFGGAASRTMSGAASGVVRVRAAYSAGVSGFVALTSGWTALTAGAFRGNIPLAVMLGGFSVAAGWLAVWNARKAVGVTALSRAAPHWLPDNPDLGLPRAAEAAAGWGSRADGTQAGGAGTTIAYSQAKLFWLAARLGLLCLLMGGLVMVLLAAAHSGGRYQSSPLGILCGLGALAYYSWRLFAVLMRATGKDLTAISWDHRSIKVRTISASRQVPWSAFESVLVKRKTVRLARLIPIARFYFLVFRICHDGASRTMEVPCSALAIPAREALDLVRRIELQRAQYVCNAAGGAMPRAADPWQPADAAWGGADAVASRRAAGFGTLDPAPVAPSAFGRKAT